MRRALKRFLFAAIVLLVVGVVAVRFLRPGEIGGTLAGIGALPTAVVAGPTKPVILFFAEADGSGLTARRAEIAPATDAGALAAEALAALFAGPPPADPVPSIAAVPPGVEVRAVFFDGKGTAILDLLHLDEKLAGAGTDGESLALWAIVDTLAFNFPADARRVRILIEGHEVETLGHVSLSSPLAPRRDLVVGDIPSIAAPVAQGGTDDETP